MTSADRATPIGILGGGKWGQALAKLVIAAGNEPLIAYRDSKPPDHLPCSDDPRAVAEATDLLIVAVSAHETANAIKATRPGPGHRVVLAGRGLEPGSSRWLTSVVLSSCESRRVGVLAGPSPADEILNGGLCAGVVASEFRDVRQRLTAALHSSRFRVYESDDLRGVELASAAMPVLATLIGVAQNLGGSGAGMHAMVLTRGLSEMGRLASAMGGQPLTLSGLAGVGDLVAAQARPGHLYFEAGKTLVANSAAKKRRKAKKTASRGPEALARALLTLANDHSVELPLTQALVTIFEGAHPLDAVGRLMSRRAQKEQA